MIKLVMLPLLLFCLMVVDVAHAQYARDSSEVKMARSPWNFSVHTGMSVGTFRNYTNQRHSFFSSYLGGTASYALSPRAGLIFGFGYERYNFNTPMATADRIMTPFNFQNAYTISGGGYYHLNEKVVLSGLMQYTMPEANQFSPMGLNNNFKSFQMNIDYKITDHFSIGAGVRYSEGNRMGNFGMPVGPQRFYPANPYW